MTRSLNGSPDATPWPKSTITLSASGSTAGLLLIAIAGPATAVDAPNIPAFLNKFLRETVINIPKKCPHFIADPDNYGISCYGL